MRTRRIAGAVPPNSFPRRSTSARQRGGALLAVLWLVAALSAIALTIAATVRAEVDLTTIHAEGVRAYFLARAGIERAALWIQWGGSVASGGGARLGGDGPIYYQPGMRSLAFQFLTGDVVVDVIPEAAKLNINEVNLRELARLFLALGADPAEAEDLSMAVEHWRNRGAAIPALDSFYLMRKPSFPARGSSLENVEELLLVRGMTPEMFYGAYVPVDTPGVFAIANSAAGTATATPGESSSFPPPSTPPALVWRAGLRDCVSVFGSISAVDVNWAEPAVLAAVGLPPQVIGAILERRRIQPFQNTMELARLGMGSLPSLSRLRVGGRSQYTLRATAWLRQQDGQPSNLRRSAAATVDLNEVAGDRPFTTLRWYDTAWKQ